jgi:vacuolar protein sorting-associated protein 3
VELSKSKTEHEVLQQELFSRLLGEYMRLEDMNERVAQTVNLLDRWGRFFDVKLVLSHWCSADDQVLDIIPDDWSVAALEKFLVSALRRTLHEKRQVKLIKSICMGQNITVHAKWVDLVSKEKPFIQTEEALAVPGSLQV